jgi:hypothetical protein
VVRMRMVPIVRQKAKGQMSGQISTCVGSRKSKASASPEGRGQREERQF